MNPSSRRRLVAKWLSLVLLASLAIPVMSLTGVAGWLWWRGELSIGTTSQGMETSPKFGKNKAAHKKRLLNPWRSAPSLDILSTCNTKAHNASEARDILASLQGAGLPGLVPDIQHRLSILFVPRPVLDFIGGPSLESKQTEGGVMVVVGTHGLLGVKGDPAPSGDILYHEAIHFNQFLGTDKIQKERIDSLWKEDKKHPFPEAAVWNAWRSVNTLIDGRIPSELAGEVQDSLVKAWAQVHGKNMSPLFITRETLSRVISRDRFAPLRANLVMFSRVRRGIAGDQGELSWLEELGRLLVFEAEASSLAIWCSGSGSGAYRAPGFSITN